MSMESHEFTCVFVEKEIYTSRLYNVNCLLIPEEAITFSYCRVAIDSFLYETYY
jgi:hypothetical protein